MPLTPAGHKTLAAMRKQYGNDEKATQVFYASIKKGKLKGMEGKQKKGTRGLGE